ncbi:MAG: hypothetical protein ABIQ30_10150 [Devosia sp.]
MKPTFYRLLPSTEDAMLSAIDLEQSTMTKPNKYARRPQLVERIEVHVPAELKRGIYEVAAAKGKPAAQFIRESLAASLLNAA